jgi:hypothetical protein
VVSVFFDKVATLCYDREQLNLPSQVRNVSPLLSVNWLSGSFSIATFSSKSLLPFDMWTKVTTTFDFRTMEHKAACG